MSAHQIPISEIKFAAKTGFLSFKLWDQYFANGAHSWRLRQWKALVIRGYFKMHPSPRAGDVLVLNPKNPKVCELVPSISSPPYISQLFHDEVVASSLLRLKNEGLISGFKTEGELKAQAVGTIQPKSASEAIKYPDAIVNVANSKSIAIEVELTRKEYKRYYKIIGNYATKQYADMILFIGNSEGIFESLRKAMRENSYPTRSQPIGFVSCEDWKSNPVTAMIHFSSHTTNMHHLHTLEIKKPFVNQPSRDDGYGETAN
ncbi:MAG: hypothetical protein K2Q26_11355 [Bdellovibrionales bacterium]|nr:hypothetical protein [Bdellovibrionales bacterium]